MLKGYCECGCGNKAPVFKSSNKRLGWAKGEPKRFVHNHHCKGSNNHGWKGGRKKHDNYFMIKADGHPKADEQGYVYEHLLIAEEILGTPPPNHVVIHHYNGYGSGNRGLVICESRSYHQLIHARKRALEACGNSAWRKCKYCHKYDDPANMTRLDKGRCHYHKKCNTNHQRERRLLKGGKK